VRTYKLTKDRVDQDLTIGNRGYVAGKVPSEEKERKTTRTTQAIEIELHPPIKFERMPKERVPTEQSKALAEEQEALGNRGYITQSVQPEITEPKSVNYEKYTVEKNDTLQKISKKFYGTTKKWMKIYEANKDSLKGPNKIYPGQVINVPVEPVTGTQEKLK
jgi:nucleoid-associated protein YgaU